MSMPLPGTYRIRSAPHHNQMFDLNGGSAKADTPVVGYANNNNTQNMLWTLQMVDVSAGTIRMINVASGTFAQPASSGAGVVGSPQAALLRIVPRSNVGEYSIQTTDGQLACTLANSKNYTQVTLQRASDNDNNQSWILCPA